jgi:broad specificity phosphatase PhoE
VNRQGVYFASASITHFQERTIKAWQSLYASHPGKHLLLITHAGVIRNILADILNSFFVQALQLDPKTLRLEAQ